jgi:hypothetical protein
MRTILFCVVAAAGCASTSKPVERPPAQQAAVRPARMRTPAETKPSNPNPSYQTAEPDTNVNEGPATPTEVPLPTPNQLP